MPATKVRKKAKASTANGEKRVNKSAAVRGRLDKDPDAKPKKIAADLAKKGIDVEPSYVSIIKSKYNGQSTAKSSNGRRGKQASQKFDLNDLVEAKKFADQIGGVERARNVLSAIAKLQ